jgi:acetyl esterase/lipase
LQARERIAVDYTLSSEQVHLWNLTIRQIGCSLAWVARNSARYGGDAGRLSLFGDSAGGNLVINAGYMANQRTLRSSCGGKVPHVATVVAMYPVVDVAASKDNADALLGAFARYLTAAYTGGTPRQYPDRYAAVSSATHINPAAPATLIIVGTNDHLVSPEGAYAFADKARTAGIEVRLVRFPHGEHGFDAVDGGIGDQLARQATYMFLKAHGQAPAP